MNWLWRSSPVTRVLPPPDENSVSARFFYSTTACGVSDKNMGGIGSCCVWTILRSCKSSMRRFRGISFSVSKPYSVVTLFEIWLLPVLT